MNAGGGQVGQGGGQSGGQGGQAGGGVPSQATVTSVQGDVATTTAGFATSTTPYSTASASAAASAQVISDGLPRSTINIIVGVCLGVVVLLAVGFLVAYMKGWMPCWTAKRKAKLAEKAEKSNGTVGIPWFTSRMPSMIPSYRISQQNSLTPLNAIPGPTTYTPGVVPTQPFRAPNSHSQAPESRDLEVNQGMLAEERNSADYFLPTYAQSQSGMSMSGRASLRAINTSHGAPSEASVSPLSTHENSNNAFISAQNDGASSISPQTTGYSGISILSPHSTGQTTTGIRSLFPEYSHDADDSSLVTSQPNQRVSIVAPVPVHPVIRQSSLERALRDGTISQSLSQAPARLLSPDQRLHPRESPVLGQQNPVRMVGVAPPPYQESHSSVARNVSGSSEISVISDGALERLGVGSRARYHPRR